MEYVPFGEVFIEERNATWNTPYLFNGKELDEETGLYYYGARYYNPRVSQWLSVDPIALYDPINEIEHYLDGQHNGGYFNPRNTSVYGYTYQNPIRFIDPNGKQSDAAETGMKLAILSAPMYSAFSAYEWYKKGDHYNVRYSLNNVGNPLPPAMNQPFYTEKFRKEQSVFRFEGSKADYQQLGKFHSSLEYRGVDGKNEILNLYFSDVRRYENPSDNTIVNITYVNYENTGEYHYSIPSRCSTCSNNGFKLTNAERRLLAFINITVNPSDPSLQGKERQDDLNKQSFQALDKFIKAQKQKVNDIYNKLKNQNNE